MSQCPSPSHSRPSIHYFYFINFFILFRVHVARVLLLPVRIYVSNKSRLPFLILILSLHNTLPFYISRQIFALFLSLKITHHRFPFSFSLFITLFLFTLHTKCLHSFSLLITHCNGRQCLGVVVYRFRFHHVKKKIDVLPFRVWR